MLYKYYGCGRLFPSDKAERKGKPCYRVDDKLRFPRNIMIHAVLFDMDGVIVDTEKYYNRTWPVAFAECGYKDFTSEDALLQRSLNRADAQRLWEKRYGKGFSFDKVRQKNAALVSALMEQEGVQKKAGIGELLAYLKENGIKSAVVTATSYERAVARLKSVGLDTAFDTVISASMVRIGKPHPDVYLYACEQIEEAPHNCIALEDSPNGIRSAFSAGCHVIMIPDLTMPTPDLESMLFAQAKTLADVIPILQSNA